MHGSSRVTYQSTTYALPTEAVGGTVAQPTFKATDELLILWSVGRLSEAGAVAVVHDTFGVLSTVLGGRYDVRSYSDNIVHHRRKRQAYAANGLASQGDPEPYLGRQPDTGGPLDCGVMHMPKNPGLFRWYLHHISRSVPRSFTLAVAFYTRHFNTRILDVAGEYAGEVHQSKAYKKARLLVLSNWRRATMDHPKPDVPAYDGMLFFQLPGVFSSKHIDYATQFLLDTWKFNDDLAATIPQTILDIGCGNGVIGETLIRNYYPGARVEGTDVSHVAVSSARQNNRTGVYHWRHDLAAFAPRSFDLIVTNPPFHDGHRNAIEPTLKLFREAAEKLSARGRFVVVANRHLNYATHLRRSFASVTEIATSKKFVIYRSTSGS